ncbi:unnamed protein product [Trichobilharzia regenti]|nr:unnamed protein product [Trichobilharzia regenti]
MNQGGVIALPTDTIYGLACSVYNTEAIERICRIKGRCETKPMAICLDQVSWGVRILFGLSFSNFQELICKN